MCHFCHDKATHKTLDQYNNTVNSCDECCGGCLSSADCGYDDEELGVYDLVDARLNARGIYSPN